MERFKKLLPGIAEIKPLEGDGEKSGWAAYDAAGTLLGYTFVMDVPDSSMEIPGMEDMDRYLITGAVDPEYKIIGLDISMHPEGEKDEPWDIAITEPEFGGQYAGLAVEELDLSPDGKIDAITDATMSSTWITGAVRDKVKELIEKTK